MWHCSRRCNATIGSETDEMRADAFRYDGKRALIVGGATGMGAATAELVLDLGAEVVVMDYADVTLAGVTAIHVNLTDRTASTERSTNAEGRSTPCSPAPVSPTARPGSRRSTSSATAI